MRTTSRRAVFAYRRPRNVTQAAVPRRRQAKIDLAAQLLLETVIAEGMLRRTGNEFLHAARGVDQRDIVEAATARLLELHPNAPFEQARHVVWADLQRLFGWAGDIAGLEIGGHA
jgi:hypothetical protein